MKKISLILSVILVTASTNLFSAENSCSQYKKWNLPTGKYNECIKNLKKEGKYKPSGVISNIGKKISGANQKYKDIRKEKAPKTGVQIWKDFRKKKNEN